MKKKTLVFHIGSSGYMNCMHEHDHLSIAMRMNPLLSTTSK
jgi:transposase-like protein